MARGWGMTQRERLLVHVHVHVHAAFISLQKKEPTISAAGFASHRIMMQVIVQQTHLHVSPGYCCIDADYRRSFRSTAVQS